MDYCATWKLIKYYYYISMGNLVQVVQSQVETKQGEVVMTINLNLNIKLDSNGNLSLDTTPISTPKLERVDLEDNSEIINFGKSI